MPFRSKVELNSGSCLETATASGPAPVLQARGTFVLGCLMGYCFPKPITRTENDSMQTIVVPCIACLECSLRSMCWHAKGVVAIYHIGSFKLS